MSVYKPTILCAVSHANQEPWIEIWKNGQATTWQQVEDSPEFTTINFFGQTPSRSTRAFDRLHENLRWSNKYFAFAIATIDAVVLTPLKYFIPTFKFDSELSDTHKSFVVGFPDTFVTYRWKILSLFRYFLSETDFDLLVVTSSSSYIRPRILVEYAAQLPEEKLYFGPLPYEGAEFVSGSFRIFSRDTIQLIVANKNKLKIDIIEDKALSLLLRDLGVEPKFMALNNISSTSSLDNLDDRDLEDKFHFRLKSETNGIRKDVEIMKKLHARFTQSD